MSGSKPRERQLLQTPVLSLYGRRDPERVQSQELAGAFSCAPQCFRSSSSLGPAFEDAEETNENDGAANVVAHDGSSAGAAVSSMNADDAVFERVVVVLERLLRRR